MAQTPPINISFAGGNEKEERYNQFKEYLILNHLDLQKERVQLHDEIVGLKIELHEKENEAQSPKNI